MAKFYFVMQHTPSKDQTLAALQTGTQEIWCLEPVKAEDKLPGVRYYGHVSLLNVPEDPAYSAEDFLKQARILVDGVAEGDVVHVMGQGQLVNATNAVARWKGASLVESVTARESEEVVQPDGSVKKVAVFRFKGFRPVYDFS